MTITRLPQKHGRKFPKQLIGYVIAIILALVGMFYAKYLADIHPQLYYEVQTSTSVLEVKEELPKLVILFDGIDIRQQNLSLQIIYVRVINDSAKGILKEYYDQEDPIGILVSAGKIIKADIIETSNDYLRKTLSIRSDQENVIYFKDVILDTHQYYLIKLLVLHPTDRVPEIKPLGYIAGMKNIEVRETYKEKGKVSVWSHAFSGPWLVQSLRLLVYFLGAGILALLVAALIVKAGERIEDNKLKRNVRKYKESTDLSLNENDEFIFGDYIWGGFDELRLIESILEDGDSLRRAWASANIAREDQILYKIPKSFKKNFPSTHDELMLTRIDALIKSGFVQDKDGDLIIDPHMKETLKSFLSYLRAHGLTQ